MNYRAIPQLCTTVEQSKRLLELGLKPETADTITPCFEPQAKPIPAWSLLRLIELWHTCNPREDEYMLPIKDTFNYVVDELCWYIKYRTLGKEYLNVV